MRVYDAVGSRPILGFATAEKQLGGTATPLENTTMEQTNTQTDVETKFIEAYQETIVDAIKGALKESEGHSHILRILTHEETAVRNIRWECLSFNTYRELQHGVDYLKVEDLADFDCDDDVYTDTWESRIDFHTEIEANGEKFRLELQY
ncbi:hypothetical protein [Natrinema sp. DC36]|uniref:hypothetical protein n=1 Tax=Natrinema sp. DC36 TaxID=2878680 RepID=UPI001CF08E76|nr:hypothetical protein [Natrinema sp. DC36]